MTQQIIKIQSTYIYIHRAIGLPSKDIILVTTTSSATRSNTKEIMLLLSVLTTSNITPNIARASSEKTKLFIINPTPKTNITTTTS